MQHPPEHACMYVCTRTAQKLLLANLVLHTYVCTTFATFLILSGSLWILCTHTQDNGIILLPVEYTFYSQNLVVHTNCCLPLPFSVYLPASLSTCLPVYLPSFLPACMHSATSGAAGAIGATGTFARHSLELCVSAVDFVWHGSCGGGSPHDHTYPKKIQNTF